MRILMLGWEFPPHISGGLGTACEGLSRGLAAGGVDVLFVIPRLVGDERAPHLMLVGAETGVPEPEIRAVPSALLPYETAAQFEARVAAAAPPRRKATRKKSATPPQLTGRYGAQLMDEVARYAESVAEIAETERVDIVHGHDWMTYPAAIRAAHQSRVPLVVHVHSLEHDRAGPRANPAIVEIEQRGFDAADAIVCVSRYTANEVARRYRVDETKLRVVHNAGPENVEHPPRGPRRIREPVVLFLGRVTYQKGPEAFLEAAARVVRVEPDVKFVVAGSGDLLPLLIERTARLKLARHVHFTGFLRGDDVDKAYAAADVYVLPSVSEPFGITPLEAAARDVPVIVSRQSGVVEVLKGALVVDSWDVEDLANKILALIRRPALRAELVGRGRQDARELTWERQAAVLRDVYEGLLL
jgi:glycosyltransferase involved in cell wall biosynthesis